MEFISKTLLGSFRVLERRPCIKLQQLVKDSVRKIPIYHQYQIIKFKGRSLKAETNFITTIKLLRMQRCTLKVKKLLNKKRLKDQQLKEQLHLVKMIRILQVWSLGLLEHLLQTFILESLKLLIVKSRSRSSKLIKVPPLSKLIINNNLNR